MRAAVLALALVACRAVSVPEPPLPALDRTLSVGFVIVDGVYGTELVAPHDVFQHTLFHADPAMSVFTVAPTREPVRSFEGLTIVPDHAFDDAPGIDVLVVPSAEHSLDTDLEDERLIAFVRERGREARYVLSLCDGAFVLAKAGLLDGLRSTTFPADIPRFRELFPRLRVVEGVSFVHDGHAITSVGGVRSYDAAMYLVERLYGAKAAQGVARGLLIEWDLARVPRVAPPAATAR